MKKNWLAGILVFCVSLLLWNIDTEAAVQTQNRSIGLHDRILPMEDIRLIDHTTKVPLADIAKYLYLPVSEENGTVHIRKRGIDWAYHYDSKQTTKDGILQKNAPITEVDGKLYINVIYIANETGFKTEYFPKMKTIRIYRDDYPHISHEEFGKKLPVLLNKKPVTQKATVYLTFDDGPNQFTRMNLKTLKKYNVHGTFFLVGGRVPSNRAVVQSVYEQGHAIGTHSMTHDKNKTYQSVTSFMKEMNDSAALVKQITGEETKLVRVPYGSQPHVTPGMRKMLAQQNFKMWDWDVDSHDWKYKDQQADQIVKNVKTGVAKANKSGNRDIVVLLHDRSQTTKALPAIIQWLQAEGYKIEPYDKDAHIVKNFHHDPKL